MRILCDACETAAAIVFCAADEAALCRACDDKVHMCNKLASRHIRVGLGVPSGVSRCDICENAPAFFYCEIDGSSLCLQCDMIVHVGGKRTHGRYLLLRQRVEFPTDKLGSLDEAGSQRVNNNSELSKRGRAHISTFGAMENQRNHSIPNDNGNEIGKDDKMENNLIDLNARPQRIHEQASHIRGRENALAENNHEPESAVPDGYFERDCDK